VGIPHAATANAEIAVAETAQPMAVQARAFELLKLEPKQFVAMQMTG